MAIYKPYLLNNLVMRRFPWVENSRRSYQVDDEVAYRRGQLIEDQLRRIAEGMVERAKHRGDERYHSIYPTADGCAKFSVANAAYELAKKGMTERRILGQVEGYIADGLFELMLKQEELNQRGPYITRKEIDDVFMRKAVRRGVELARANRPLKRVG